MRAEGYLNRVFQKTSEAVEQAILDACPGRRGGTLLDLGCGEGRLTMALAQRVGSDRVIGVDIWEPSLAAARALGVETVRHDMREPLPFADTTIDVVHSNQVIEHLPDTDLFLREIRRVLRPGGYALICTNNLASWHNIASLVIGVQPEPCHVSGELWTGLLRSGPMGNSYPTHLRVFTGRALNELCAHHGLRTDLALGVGYYPLPARPAALAARLDRRHAAYLLHRVTCNGTKAP
jgi:SAM-dependent methyltransferase